MNLSITLGDVVIAVTLAGSIFTAYNAMKGQLATLRSVVDAFNLRMDQQAQALRRHGQDIRYYGRRTAAIEGKVFGRRIDDRMPSEREQAAGVDLEDPAREDNL